MIKIGFDNKSDLGKSSPKEQDNRGDPNHKITVVGLL